MRTLTFWLLLASLAIASEPAKLREVSPAAGNEIRIVEAPGPGSWKIFSADSLADIPSRTSGTLAIIDAPAGSYVVLWRPAGGQWQQLELIVGKVKPSPKPQPKPAPLPSKIFAVIVEETAVRGKLTPDQIQALVSAKPGEYMAARAFGYRVVDQDVRGPDGQQPGEIAAFLAAAKGKQLPWLIVADQAGAVLFEGPVSTEAALLETLKKYGG